MFYLCNIHFSIVALNTLFRYIKSASALKFLLTGLIKFPPCFVESINEAITLVPPPHRFLSYSFPCRIFPDVLH